MRIPTMPLVLACLMVGGMAACDGDGMQPVLDPPELPGMEQDGVRAAVVIEERSDGAVTLAVHVEARAVALGSYQGRLEYDTGRFTLLEAEAPAGQDGFRIANAAEPGVVRFAGFTTREFESPVVLRMRMRAPAELNAQELAVVLEVAGTVEGAVVERSHYQTPLELFSGSSRAVR